MDDIERRLISLEKNSEYYKEQFEMYCLSHKDEHRQTIERIEKVEASTGNITAEIAKISTSIALILAAVAAKDEDKKSQRLLIGAVLTTSISGIVTIASAIIMLKGGKP